MTELNPGSVAVAMPPGNVPPVQIVFDKVSIVVDLKDKAKTQKKILSDVSGIFGPGEAIAVMGPSGSGKTTMLNALTGVSVPSSGSITVNGQAFSKPVVKAVSALVPQDDLLTPIMTVYESLLEATTFKTSLPRAEACARVDDIIKQFDLSVCKDVLVGHPEGRKGISGGQKRRLSVALELCGEPSLLYLDEPTSGLDSVSAMALVRLMSSLAKGGRTIVATIHQPSSSAFFTFDRLLLLVGGSICYSGPVSQTQPMAYFASAGFECPPLNNPADFMFDVLVGNTETLRLKFEKEGVAEDGSRAPQTQLPPLSMRSKYPASFFLQVKTHVIRNRRQLLRDPALARLRVGSSVVMGVTMGIMYNGMGTDLMGVNDRVSLLLFTMLFLAISNSIPVVIAVFPELTVAAKQCHNNWYSPNSFVPAKILIETPLLVIPPFLFLLIGGSMSNLSRDADGTLIGQRFCMMWLALFLVVSSSHAWALFICSVSPSMDVAFLAAPGSIMPMSVCSGFFKNQQDMSWVFRWFTYVDFLNYGWQCMATAGFHGLNFTDAGPYTTGEEVLEYRLNLPNPSLGGYFINVLILAGFMIGFRVFGTLMIARKLKM